MKALENYQKIGYDKIQEIANSEEPAREKVKKLIELAANGSSNDKKKVGCQVSGKVYLEHGKKAAGHRQISFRQICLS
jgi:hypothetical protein